MSQDIKNEFEKAFWEWYPLVNGTLDIKDDLEIALWAAQWMAEKCASIANHKMGEKDPAYAVACSDLKIIFRQIAKDLS